MPDDPKRRGEDMTVDKTMRVTTTVGSLIAVIAGVWFIGRWTDQIEDENILIYQEVHEVLDIAQRNERRLQTYIDRNNDTHDQDEVDDHELLNAIQIIREFLAAKYGEVLP